MTATTRWVVNAHRRLRIFVIIDLSTAKAERRILQIARSALGKRPAVELLWLCREDITGRPPLIERRFSGTNRSAVDGVCTTAGSWGSSSRCATRTRWLHDLGLGRHRRQRGASADPGKRVLTIGGHLEQTAPALANMHFALVYHDATARNNKLQSI